MGAEFRLRSRGSRADCISKSRELKTLLDRLSAGDIAATGLVLEENLERVTTLSVGHIMVDDIKFTYYGRQRLTTDNGQSVYGGSDLVCVRGGWDDLERSQMSNEIRIAVKQARLYDEAMSEYPGFIASRRNYDVGQGIDYRGSFRSGVLGIFVAGRGSDGSRTRSVDQIRR